MPFNRPSPQSIRDRLAAEVALALPGADARTRRSVEEVLVRVVAVASHELHGHLAWTAQQILPDRAEQDVLERHAAIWGVARRQAAAAGGSVGFTGVAGAIIPAGSELRRADDARYTLDADVAIGGAGTGGGTVTALLAGAAGNAVAATPLAFLAPVLGIAGDAAVAAGGIGGGADAESDDELRARLIARIQSPPAGGAHDDYVQWAQGVPGVGRVWVYPNHLGPGTVGVAFLTSAGDVPDAGLIADVAAAIALLRPVTAAVTVFALATAAQDLAIALHPDSLAIRAAVQAEVAAFYKREVAPGGTIWRSRLSEAISAAAGENAHTLIAPAGDVVLPEFTIAVPGTIGWA
ncbi:MAG TPA: baseplate J/gp47 family protein [Roseomonas sp.]|jgi:uncharacterized phage protein gp47/JayE